MESKQPSGISVAGQEATDSASEDDPEWRGPTRGESALRLNASIVLRGCCPTVIDGKDKLGLAFSPPHDTALGIYPRAAIVST